MQTALIDRISKAIRKGEVISLFERFTEYKSLPSFLKDETVGFPPILQATFQINKDTDEWRCVNAFERLNIELRNRVFKESKENSQKLEIERGLNSVGGEELAKCIIKEIKYYENRRVLGIALAEPSIHIEGLYIDGDVDLSCMQIPCSFRLINCVIGGGLILDRASVVTLDLSGSIIHLGLSAPHIKISGALRLRRTVLTGILDLGASEIHGPVDAQDSVCIPQNLPPNGVVWVSDRSLVNFGLAQIGKQMRLNRVRWFGGVDMRGMHVHGSLFMTDAIIRSPLAVAEKIIVENYTKRDNKFPAHTRSAALAEQDLAQRIHIHADKRDGAVQGEILKAIVLPGCPNNNGIFNKEEFKGSLLARLLFENVRVYSNAIRADGAIIDGVFSAESMRIGGRLRLKKINVRFTLVFSGSHIRTFRSLRSTLVKLDDYCPEPEPEPNFTKQFAEYILGNLDEADDSIPSIRRQYAVDLRRANIGNSVEFRKDTRKLDGQKLVSAEGEFSQANKKIQSDITQKILEKLCLHKEDPIKYLQIFFRRPGEVNDFLDNEKNSVGASRDDFTLYNKARENLWKIGEKIVPRVHEVLQYERAKDRYEKSKDKGENCLDAPEEPSPDPLSGRVTESLDEKQKREVIEICCDLGRLNSTLLIGEISLAGAHVGGSLTFLGMIANVFDDDEHIKRPTILIDNAEIRDDVDFRGTVGLQSISAEQARITGSVRMSNEPKFILRHDRYGPARRRALFVSSPQREDVDEFKPFLKHRFERAEIGGDAIFVFDHEHGPTLDLSFLKVKGKLAILPARGGIELAKKEIAAESNDAERIRDFGKMKIREILPLKMVAFGAVGNVTMDDSRSPKKDAQTFKPYIDLRNSYATVFSHPPSAWPQQDWLLIEGLRYDRSKDVGPLLPERRTWRMVETAWENNKVPMFWTIIVSVLVSFVALGLIASFSTWLFLSPQAYTQVPKLQGFPVKIMFDIWLMGPAFGFLFVGIWIYSMQRFTYPKAADMLPLAVRYLRLQRRKFNARRTRAAVQPFESYLHAAKILRADGHILSADRVELERLRMRRQALSRRTSAPLRFMLKVTDLTMEYGFAPVRIIAIAITIMFVGTLMTDAADRGTRFVASQTQPAMGISTTTSGSRSGTLIKRPNNEPTSDGNRADTQRPERQHGTADLVDVLPNPIGRIPNRVTSQTPPQDKKGNDIEDEKEVENLDMRAKDCILIDGVCHKYEEKRLRPFLYVVDVMIPFLDLQQESRFEFRRLIKLAEPEEKSGKPEEKSSDPGTEKYDLAEWFLDFFWVVPVILKISGWILTSIIVLAGAARLETFMARDD